MSPAEILEEALSERLGRDLASAGRPRKREEIRAWLDELAALSAKIPPRTDETFSSEMAYQDHD